MNFEITWPDILEAQFGTALTDRQVAVWEHFLRDFNPKAGEISESITFAAREGITVKYRANVRDVAGWLERYRSVKLSQNLVVSKENRIKDFISQWKEKLSRGADQNDFIECLDKFKDVCGLKITESNDIAREVLFKR